MKTKIDSGNWIIDIDGDTAWLYWNNSLTARICKNSGVYYKLAKRKVPTYVTTYVYRHFLNVKSNVNAWFLSEAINKLEKLKYFNFYEFVK